MDVVQYLRKRNNRKSVTVEKQQPVPIVGPLESMLGEQIKPLRVVARVTQCGLGTEKEVFGYSVYGKNSVLWHVHISVQEPTLSLHPLGLPKVDAQNKDRGLLAMPRKITPFNQNIAPLRGAGSVYPVSPNPLANSMQLWLGQPPATSANVGSCARPFGGTRFGAEDLVVFPRLSCFGSDFGTGRLGYS